MSSSSLVTSSDEVEGDDNGIAPSTNTSPASAPKVAGATAPSESDLNPGDDDDYIATDCDDLDNCNRPTNPTSDTFRFSNRKPSTSAYSAHNSNSHSMASNDGQRRINLWWTSLIFSLIFYIPVTMQ